MFPLRTNKLIIIQTMGYNVNLYTFQPHHRIKKLTFHKLYY